MKIKFDFVTNSSSTSFVAMGAYIDPKQIPDEKIEALLERYENSTIESLRKYACEYIDALLVGSDLTYSSGYYDGDQMMIGINYNKMKDEETLADFKERVKFSIKSKLGLDVEVGHIQECWMDN